jgi:hypothetical protein
MALLLLEAENTVQTRHGSKDLSSFDKFPFKEEKQRNNSKLMAKFESILVIDSHFYASCILIHI